jgi:hypothetical protein
MTSAKRPDSQDQEEPQVMFFSPEEALQHAKTLPPRAEIVIEGVSAEEWELFRKAITS